jgi:3'-phosphoadenosine 5'-phosphosulfate sulfotransferase (PAPS reductase)/FAD synthetase
LNHRRGSTSDAEQLRLVSGPSPDVLLAQAKERWEPVRTYCLFSGGNDSGVLAHRCRRSYDALAFIDTGTAIPGVADFVRDYAEWLEKPLIVKRSEGAYRQMVLGDERWWQRYQADGAGLTHDEFRARDKEIHGQWEGTVRGSGFQLGYFPWGFPGIGAHGKSYSRLKERRIEELIAEAKVGSPRSANVLLVSGVRRAESLTRSRYHPFSERGAGKYVNPLIDWSNHDMAGYREEHQIPESDIAALLHRSGECNCAARGKWWEERGLIRALWPIWFDETIGRLESEAEALGVRWCRWGGFDLVGNRAGAVSEETPGPLCARCMSEQIELVPSAPDAAVGFPIAA